MLKTIAICLILTLSVSAQAQVNSMDTCLKDIKGVTHKVLNSIQLGLGAGYFDMAMRLIESAADAFQAVEDCQPVNKNDAFMWIDQNATPHQIKCISDFAAMGISIKKAQDDKNSGGDRSLLMKDWSDVIGKLDIATSECMLE